MLSTSFDRRGESKWLTSSAKGYLSKRDVQVASSVDLRVSTTSLNLNKKNPKSIVIVPNESENLVTETMEIVNRGDVNGPGGEENVPSSEENQPDKTPQINLQLNNQSTNNLV